jgi:aldose 1-epimerase
LTFDAGLRLARGDVELILAPAVGGSIAALRWRGHDLLRSGNPADGPLALGSFPLVPFSNRIAGGAFGAHGHRIHLPPNMGDEVIHGFGWQSVWDVAEAGEDSALLVHEHAVGDWPWAYRAEQRFTLTPSGLVLAMTLTNLGGGSGSGAMPAGMGHHPYFPRAGAALELAVAERWDCGADRLPARLTPLPAPPDWLGGPPLDHGFTHRRGPITVRWPDRTLTIAPDPDLGHVVVYTPAGDDFFCVEPVSHMTNAVNRAEGAAVTGLRWLDAGDSWTVTTIYLASEPDRPPFNDHRG